MVKLEPQMVVDFIFRTIVALLLIAIMMVAFFSFRVDVRDDSMKRFLVEVADALASSELTDHKSIFNPQKLTDAERKDTSRNVELYAVNCDYGYSVDIESVFGETACNSGNDCRNFCKTACGLDESTIDMSTIGTINGNCGCNLEIVGSDFCQCKKENEWQSTYKWGYGYVPSSEGLIAGPSAEFPVGLSLGEQVVPAKMRLTAYDSFLTRITCAAKKAYELKEKTSFTFATGNVKQISDVKQYSVLKRKGNEYACMYFLDQVDYCRYFPDVPFMEFKIIEPAGAKRATIAAYPIKTPSATCENVKADSSLVAGKNDQVSNILFCMEGK